MGFRCGIVGLPNVGKSTLFNALTSGAVPAENYPFCTVDRNHGVVPVPDLRLEQVAALYRPEKVTPTALEFVDIAGLVKGASQNEGLGNKFLSHIQEVDAYAHLVRCFADDQVVHVHGAIDPLADVEVVEAELILRDLDLVSRRVERVRHAAQVGEAGLREELEALEAVERVLARGAFAATAGAGLQAQLPETPLITTKPYLLVANVKDGQLDSQSDPALATLRQLARSRGVPLVEISARTEAELNELEPADRQAFLSELGWRERGLHRLVRAGYQLLNLITFFTTVGTEIRAWTVPRDTTAVHAAGKIHSDFERGFIRAEVIHHADLIALGSEQAAREKGLLRVEGRDYVVQDGDVIRFRFNV